MNVSGRLEISRLRERRLARLRSDGFCVLPRTLSPGLAAALLREARAESSRLRELPADELRTRLAPIHGARLREDIALPITPCARRALRKLVNRHGRFLSAILSDPGDSVRGYDDGIGIRLVEFGAVTSYPGAAAQPWHADVDRSGEDEGAALILHIFVALQNINAEMGPTEVLPGTNTLSFHSRVRNAAGPRGRSQRRFSTCSAPHHIGIAAARLAPRPAQLFSPLKAGAVAVMNAHCFHRGGPNFSDKPRSLLHLAFMADGARPPKSFTYTLVPQATRPWFTLDGLRSPNTKGKSARKVSPGSWERKRLAVKLCIACRNALMAGTPCRAPKRRCL